MWCPVISKEAWLAGNYLVPLFLLALFLVLIGYGIAWARFGISPLAPMGTGSWKFTESWASTLTGSSALLGLILAAQVLPPENAGVKNTYVMFNLMFGMIIVFAALLYNVLRLSVMVPGTNGSTIVVENPTKVTVIEGGEGGTPPTVTENPEQVTVDGGQTVTATENQGIVLVFLVACVLVLWAVFGQLITTCHLIGDIESLPASLNWIFDKVIFVSGLLAIVYSVASVTWTLYTQKVREVTGQGKGFILP